MRRTNANFLKALVGVGKAIQGETFARHRPVMNIFEKNPVLAVDTFVAPNASIIGQVRTKKWSFISSEIIYILIV